MQIPDASYTIHKAWLFRLLREIAEDVFLVKNLRFKGGTYASMRGLIDRFSVDLDFNLLDPKKNKETRLHLETLFKKLDMKIKEKSQKVPQYFLKYPSEIKGRNTIKVDVTFPAPKNNDYEPVRFVEIDKILYCETVPTMFANKLVAFWERYQKNNTLAGRDLFDIHTFFIKGFLYKNAIIQERTGLSGPTFLKMLKKFIEKKVTQTVIDQDLNMLLAPKQFQAIRKILKQEVVMFLSKP